MAIFCLKKGSSVYLPSPEFQYILSWKYLILKIYLMPKVIKNIGIRDFLIRITHSIEQLLGEKYLYIQMLISYFSNRCPGGECRTFNCICRWPRDTYNLWCGSKCATRWRLPVWSFRTYSTCHKGASKDSSL